MLACNTVFLISTSVLDIEEEIKDFSFGKSINVTPFSFDDLIESSIKENPWDILEKIIFERCITV